MDARPREPVLSDRYELGPKLGQGGMAEVFMGQDRVLGRRVAIKLLAGDTAPHPGQAQRLRSEARAAASIEHPNVVRVYDFTLTEASIFVVMEYLEGETLRARLRRESTLPPDLAARIGAEVCLALDAAHRAGVVHRDIGPGNIMLCPDGMVKVMDFGIARIAGNTFQTGPGQALGTPAYVSPEQADGSLVDARCDLYSLGCTLYHAVAGSPPFTGPTPIEVAHQHVHATPEPPRTHNPDVPADLEAVILQALAKDPARRFDDALQMRTALLATLPGSPTPDEPADDAAGTASTTVPLPREGHARLHEHTHRTPPAIDLALLEGAEADRRRYLLGVALILLALAVLAVASSALLYMVRGV
jgi:eukaryotic-like serine/threonine-protein kinase